MLIHPCILKNKFLLPLGLLLPSSIYLRQEIIVTPVSFHQMYPPEHKDRTSRLATKKLRHSEDFYELPQRMLRFISSTEDQGRGLESASLTVSFREGHQHVPKVQITPVIGIQFPERC